jgi:alpha-mannosidase
VDGTSAWTIGEIIKTEDVTDIEKVNVIEEGPVRACIETTKRWGRSKIIQRTYLYRSYPRIDYQLEVHWFEQGTEEIPSPMLRAVFPLSLKDARFHSQVPFDVVERPVGDDPVPSHLQHSTLRGLPGKVPGGQEVPAQRWVDVSDGRIGMALLNRTKYGHSYIEGALRLTLLRSPSFPDQYPNQGKFQIEYALYPHEGDWRNGVWKEGDAYNIPAYAAEPPSLALGQDHSTKPEEDSFISLLGENVFLSGIKRAEEGEELIIRLVETEGLQREVTLTLPREINGLRKLNLIELPLEEDFNPDVSGSTVRMRIAPHEILTLGIKFGNVIPAP